MTNSAVWERIQHAHGTRQPLRAARRLDVTPEVLRRTVTIQDGRLWRLTVLTPAGWGDIQGSPSRAAFTDGTRRTPRHSRRCCEPTPPRRRRTAEHDTPGELVRRFQLRERRRMIAASTTPNLI